MSLQDKRFVDENSEKIPEFFRLMTRQFTAEEWMQIKSNTDSPLPTQLANFFRFWTLKESFVKGHGHGLGWDLQRLNFKVNSSLEKVGEISDKSELYLDGELAKQWRFEETLLDARHCVATAIKGQGQKGFSRKIPFTFLTCDQILDSLEPLNLNQSDSEWSEYLSKIEEKPF